MILIDNIVVYIYDHSFLNFLRCISESRRIKQTWKFSFLEKLGKWKANYNILIYLQVNLLRCS